MLLKKLSCPNISRITYVLFCHIILCLSQSIAWENKSEEVEYVQRVWTVEDGLPQNTIQSLLQTSDGYLWIGTPAGLVRFDGVRFTSYTRWNLSALKNENVTCLYQGRNSTLWIGTHGGGVVALQKGLWKNYSLKDGLSSNFINTIIEDWQGNIWIGTDFGLNRISDNKISVITTENGLLDNIITALATDAWNNLWIGTFRGGLAKYHDKITEVYGYQQDLKSLSIQSLFTDQNSYLWIGTMEGMYYIKRNEGIIYTLRGTSYTPVTCINYRKNDCLMVGTMVDGVKRIKDKQFLNCPGLNHLPDNYIRCIITDREGNFWIGTDGGGMIQIKKEKINTITIEDGLPQQMITAILQDSKGSLWIGTRNRGLCNLEDHRVIRIIGRQSGLGSNKISALAEDDEGVLWVGTKGGGVSRILPNRIAEPIQTGQGLLSDQITAIMQDSTKSIWIGTDTGLNRITKDRIQVIPFAEQDINPHINVLLEIDKKTILAGTKSGLYQIRDDSLVSYMDNDDSGKSNVVSLYMDRLGVLWIGTKGGGIIRYCGGEKKRLTKDQGLHDNHIFSLTEDNYNNLWLSSNSGIFRLKRRELDYFFSDSIDFVHPSFYDESDGMVSRQCCGDVQPSVWNSENNHLYYPTTNGLVEIDLENITMQSEAPITILETVLSDQDTIYQSNDPIQKIYHDRITFYFTGIDFNSPQKLYFRYMLEGLNTHYSYLGAGKERRITYRNLSPGKYRFILQAINNEGDLTNQAAFFAFEIRPPLYLNPILLLTLIVIGLTASSYVVYYKHQKRIQRQLEKYKTLTLDPSIAKKTAEKLIHLMESEQRFLDPDLSLGNLAKDLNIHYNHISRIINDTFGMSYNDFVNKYRIDEIKKRLNDQNYRDKTILEIMYETGFYSKSVFNTAFKKFTGMTPSEYKKSTLNDLSDQI